MLKDKTNSHGLANKLTPMRIRLEKFLLDYPDVQWKNKDERETLKEAIFLIKKTVVQIDDIFEYMDKNYN